MGAPRHVTGPLLRRVGSTATDAAPAPGDRRSARPPATRSRSEPEPRPSCCRCSSRTQALSLDVRRERRRSISTSCRRPQTGAARLIPSLVDRTDVQTADAYLRQASAGVWAPPTSTRYGTRPPPARYAAVVHPRQPGCVEYSPSLRRPSAMRHAQPALRQRTVLYRQRHGQPKSPRYRASTVAFRWLPRRLASRSSLAGTGSYGHLDRRSRRDAAHRTTRAPPCSSRTRTAVRAAPAS